MTVPSNICAQRQNKSFLERDSWENANAPLPAFFICGPCALRGWKLLKRNQAVSTNSFRVVTFAIVDNHSILMFFYHDADQILLCTRDPATVYFREGVGIYNAGPRNRH
jgi:hypothetical protein